MTISSKRQLSSREFAKLAPFTLKAFLACEHRRDIFAEFLRAFRQHGYWKSAENGGKGRMRLRHGYYAAGGLFVNDEEAAPHGRRPTSRQSFSRSTAGSPAGVSAASCA